MRHILSQVSGFVLYPKNGAFRKILGNFKYLFFINSEKGSR
jgi:hypothetical protein